MVTLYNADPITGKYLSGHDTEAVENPMYNPQTHDNADRYLYNSRTSSLTAPPTTKENKCAVLVDEAWEVRIDRVGQFYFQPDGKKIEIVEIGVDIPDGCIQDGPPSVYHKTHNGDVWIFDLANAQADIKVAIHTEKKRSRDGGVEVDGILFDTDINAQVMYRGFKDEVVKDPFYTVDKWRASSEGGFVVMTAELLDKIQAAGKQLFTNVFAWQSRQEALVDAATNLEALEQINTTYPTKV